MAPRCRRVNRKSERCGRARGHAGKCGLALEDGVDVDDPSDLDDPSEDVMAYQQRRDEELREEEPNP